MKRIQSACLLQTLHFQLKEEGVGHELAARAVEEEVAHYKAQLERSHIRYRIAEETRRPDDSIVLKIRKQYNSHDVGDYLE